MNGTGCSTSTLVATLPHCGLTKIFKFVSILCVCMKGCMQGIVWIEPDNMCVYAACGMASPVCGGGVAVCCRGKPSVYGWSVCKGRLG